MTDPRATRFLTVPSMTDDELRDWFAGQAVAGTVYRYRPCDDAPKPAEVAADANAAFLLADAMMERRRKPA